MNYNSYQLNLGLEIGNNRPGTDGCQSRGNQTQLGCSGSRWGTRGSGLETKRSFHLMLYFQGIDLGDQEETQKEIDHLEKMLSKFKEDMTSYFDIAKDNVDYIEKISSSFREVTDDYNKLVKLVDNVKKLLKDTEILAVKEASLTISLEEMRNIG